MAHTLRRDSTCHNISCSDLLIGWTKLRVLKEKKIDIRLPCDVLRMTARIVEIVHQAVKSVNPPLRPDVPLLYTSADSSLSTHLLERINPTDISDTQLHFVMSIVQCITSPDSSHVPTFSGNGRQRRKCTHGDLKLIPSQQSPRIQTRLQLPAFRLQHAQ